MLCLFWNLIQEKGKRSNAAISYNWSFQFDLIMLSFYVRITNLG